MVTNMHARIALHCTAFIKLCFTMKFSRKIARNSMLCLHNAMLYVPKPALYDNKVQL